MARADKNTLTRKKIVIYQDFTTNFVKNPFTGYLQTVDNEDAISQSFRQLFLTNAGERFFDSDKGGNLIDSLFENADSGQLEAMKLSITTNAEIYEPRAQIKSIDFDFGDLDNNTMNIKIVYTAENLPTEQTLNLSIRRVR